VESAARIGEITFALKFESKRPSGKSKIRRHNIKSNIKEIRECSSKKHKDEEYCSGIVNSVISLRDT